MTAQLRPGAVEKSKEPVARQYAALCHRESGRGREVLLITSSEGRWICPKGWPIDGLSPVDAALQEAWEEAGVRDGVAEAQPVGTYLADKSTGEGEDILCRTTVYAVEVTRMRDAFPEADRRERRWVPLADAARETDEDGLRDIFRAFARRHAA